MTGGALAQLAAAHRPVIVLAGAGLPAAQGLPAPSPDRDWARESVCPSCGYTEPLGCLLDMAQPLCAACGATLDPAGHRIRPRGASGRAGARGRPAAPRGRRRRARRCPPGGHGGGRQA